MIYLLNRHHFTLILILTLSVVGNGQTNQTTVDSLERMLLKFTKPNKERVDALNELGCHYWIVNPNKSISNGQNALKLAKKIDYTRGIAKSTRVLGVAYWTLGQTKLALENLTVGQRIYEEIGDDKGAANCLMNGGMVYADIGDLDRALKIYREAIERFTKLDLKTRIATTFNKIGSILIQKDNLDEAREYLTNALRIHSNNNFHYGMSESHRFLGELFLLQEELEQADYHLRQALDLSKRVNDVDGHIGNLVLSGKLHRLRNDFKNSENSLLLAMDLGRKNSLRKYSLEAYREMILLKKTKSELNEVLNYYDAYIALKDSIYSIKRFQQIAAMEYTNELNRNQHEIISLLREKETSNKFLNWGLSGFLIIVSSFGFVAFRNNRQRNKTKHEILEKEKKILETNAALTRTALDNANLRQKEMEQQLEFKNRELTSFTLNFVQKKELFDHLLRKIEKTKKASVPLHKELLDELHHDIKKQVQIDKDWKDFKKYFKDIHSDFIFKLKMHHSNLSSNDLKICTLTRLNLNIKETANVLGISPSSAKTARYRLRKKLNLTGEQELFDYFIEFEKDNQKLWSPSSKNPFN